MSKKRVRVKDPVSGAEYDVPPSRLVVCPELVVLDKPTGRTKPRLPLGTPFPGSKAARGRATKTTTADKPQVDETDGQSVVTEEEN